MRLDNNFKLINKDKIIIWSVVGVVSAFFFAMLMLTISYQKDKELSEYFNKWMLNSNAVRALAAYAIKDGYVGILTFIMPMLTILIYKVALFFSKHKPGSKLSLLKPNLNMIMITINIVWNIFLILFMAIMTFKDEGFGVGFSHEFFVGIKYLVPIFFISIFIQSAYLWSSFWFLKKKIFSQEKFYEQDYWQRAMVALIFVGIIYLPVTILKHSMARPYLINITWGDLLETLKFKYPDKYEYYMNQTDFEYGWKMDELLTDQNNAIYNIPSNFEFPWWKATGNGWVKSNEFGNGQLPFDMAFPSGHMAAAMGMGMNLYVLTSKKTTDKTILWTKRIGLVTTLIYVFYMALSLQVSLSHWLSDTSFTVAIAPAAFGIAYLLTHKVFIRLAIESISKKLKTEKIK